jgi:hypothetical protein
MISKDILDKMDHARRFLAAPAPEVVGDLIAEIRILTAQRDEAVNNYETAQLLSIRVGEQRDRLAEALRNYMSAFGQGLEAHGIPMGEQQVEADANARNALQSLTPKQL